MLNNLLIYRLLIVNFCGLALVVWGYLQGYVTEVFVGDESHITYVIVGLFLVGCWSVFTRAVKVSRVLNALKRGDVAEVEAAKFLAKGDHIADISGWLVTLGLLGTVVGFVMALGAMDQGAMSSASGVQQAIGALIDGMKTAIYTTLAGAFFGLWLDVTRRILATATVLMIEDAKA